MAALACTRVGAHAECLAAGLATGRGAATPTGAGFAGGEAREQPWRHREGALVRRFVAMELEVRGQPRVLEHVERVGAQRRCLPLGERVLFVQTEGGRGLLNVACAICEHGGARVSKESADSNGDTCRTIQKFASSGQQYCDVRHVR